MQKAKEAVGDCKLDETLPSEQQIDALAECLKRKADQQIERNEEEIAFQTSVRKEMGSKLLSYTCESAANFPFVNVTTTPSVLNSTRDGKLVETLFESDYSSVKFFHDFLRPEHCASLQRGEAVSDPIKAKMHLLARKELNLPMDSVSGLAVRTDDATYRQCEV